MFALAIAGLPILFSMLFGQIAPEGIAAGIALSPVAALGLMFVYVRCIKKEKMFDYGLLNLD